VIFVADESLDGPIIDALRELGYEVVSIAETAPGTSVSEVLDIAVNARAILLTADKDFGDLVFRQLQLHSGVVLVRLPGSHPNAKAAIVAREIAAHETELQFAFCVISERLTRIRRVV
jgi:predicted nuclease of predicted toxin-antitoxin system